ncbi:MAG: GspH/FimT family pseudopilin [Undibacterium sp.]|uniref:GspH/FimT family pseudopilin n=1 Tax=Undibacterium sp. TaxID=1914977 RepID=UPI00272895F6|nr:GspH/FimT family pseudopilin [Undibacterium sp.]MDO8651304.1 GspH/FimT family pseudopilin [Undibacterium sp.]
MSTIEKNGFTLVELLVTITIMGVMLAMAAPNYQSFVLNSRMTTQANEFLTMLNFTRSEAVKRNTRVTMCKSSNGTTCLVDALTVTSASWQPGWIIFVDGGTAGIIDGTDTILKVQGALVAGTTLQGNANIINYVSYVSNGRTQLDNGGLQGGTFSLCGPDVSLTRRRIVITPSTSRVRVDKVAAAPICTA